MNTVSFVFQNSRLIKASILKMCVWAGRTRPGKKSWLRSITPQCGDILEKLPRGADTVIGTKGVYLSGGEQQRIAIARVMLKDAPVIILMRPPLLPTRIMKPAYRRLSPDCPRGKR